MTTPRSWSAEVEFEHGGRRYRASLASNGIAVVRRDGSSLALIEDGREEGDGRPACGSSFSLVGGRPLLAEKAARAIEAYRAARPSVGSLVDVRA